MNRILSISHPMTKPRQHFFVCINTRPPFAKPSCGQCAGNEILFRLRELAEQAGVQEQVKINGTTCLGPCEQGAVIVVYPAGIWYGGVTLADVEEIFEFHVKLNQPVTRLLLKEISQ